MRSDLLYAVRVLWRTPGFTLAVMLVLALGIGANFAIFTALDQVVIRPLPYAESDRLATLWEDFSAFGVAKNRSHRPHFSTGADGARHSRISPLTPAQPRWICREAGRRRKFSDNRSRQICFRFSAYQPFSGAHSYRKRNTRIAMSS